MCKKHIYEADIARNSNPDKKRRLQQWKMCWADSKKFKQTSIGMTQAEVDDKISDFDSDRKCAYGVMPIDTEKQVTSKNCVVVTLDTRKKLMKFVERQDLKAYNQMISAICSKNE